MPKTCNNCGTEKTPATVPYVVHKSAMARAERQSKRLVAVIVILIALFAGYVAFDKWHDSQYEDVVETEEIIVDADRCKSCGRFK